MKRSSRSISKSCARASAKTGVDDLSAAKTGVSDLSDMDNSEISALCRQFVYYLREKRDNGSEVLEKDGRPMLDGININA